MVSPSNLFEFDLVLEVFDGLAGPLAVEGYAVVQAWPLPDGRAALPPGGDPDEMPLACGLTH